MSKYKKPKVGFLDHVAGKQDDPTLDDLVKNVQENVGEVEKPEPIVEKKEQPKTPVIKEKKVDPTMGSYLEATQNDPTSAKGSFDQKITENYVPPVRQDNKLKTDSKKMSAYQKAVHERSIKQNQKVQEAADLLGGEPEKPVTQADLRQIKVSLASLGGGGIGQNEAIEIAKESNAEITGFYVFHLPLMAGIKYTQKMKDDAQKKAVKAIGPAMKRAEKAIKQFSNFMEKIEEVVTNVVSSSDADVFHPLLLQRDVEKKAYVLITSDRGLAGGYNSNVLKLFAADCLMDECEAAVYAIGKKAFSFAKNKGYNLVNTEIIQNRDEVTFQSIKLIARQLVELYQSGEVDKIVIYYSHYVNTLTQEPSKKTLLPIETKHERSSNLYDFEGGAQMIIDNVLPLYIENIIYGIILDAKASEHASRMTAMQSATDNALEIIKVDGLRVEYQDGFGLMRASNTTPVLTLRIEAETLAAMQRIQQELATAIAPLPFPNIDEK